MRGVEKIIAVLLLAVAIVIPACSQKEANAAGKIPAINAKTVKNPSGLAYQDIKVGKGASPVKGRMVRVHYTGWLVNGKKFDSSVDRNEPFEFNIGSQQVIPGWDEGVMTMKVGGKRRLTIPPALGYGARGAGGDIPPNATLIFDVELLDVQK